MKTLNEELIKKLRNGDVVVEHTGMVEELREILKAAFPGSPIANGDNIFYKKGLYYWTAQKSIPELPTHPTSDFFIEEEVLKWGEPVMGRDSENGGWYDGYLYVGRNPKICGNHIVVAENGCLVSWKYCKRHPQKPRFSRAEYAEKLGISVDQINDIELVD